MTQQSLIHDTGTTCGWCLAEQATTTLYATPTCIGCASAKPGDRVKAWLQAVAKRTRPQESR